MNGSRRLHGLVGRRHVPLARMTSIISRLLTIESALELDPLTACPIAGYLPRSVQQRMCGVNPKLHFVSTSTTRVGVNPKSDFESTSTTHAWGSIQKLIS